LSLGPFLYAHFVRESSYFHEHTLGGAHPRAQKPFGGHSRRAEVMRDEISRGKWETQAGWISGAHRKENSSRLNSLSTNYFRFSNSDKRQPVLDQNIDRHRPLVSEVVQPTSRWLNLKATESMLRPIQHPHNILRSQKKSSTLFPTCSPTPSKFTLQGEINLEVKQENKNILVFRSRTTAPASHPKICFLSLNPFSFKGEQHFQQKAPASASPSPKPGSKPTAATSGRIGRRGERNQSDFHSSPINRNESKDSNNFFGFLAGLFFL